MNSNTLSKFRLFGKVGKIIMTVLSVIAMLITIICGISASFTATLPQDALTVNVVEQTELRFSAESFGTLWNILGGSFSYSGENSPEQMLKGKKSDITPPENTEFSTELRVFNQSYDSAEIRSDSDTKIMEAKSTPSHYNVKNLVGVFVFATLFAASATVALWMLRRLFAILTRCDSPFCIEVVRKMKAFGFSLLPVAVFASVSETLLDSFLSAGKSADIRVQWGILIAFVVTMALVAVFRYGVQLQKESDETL